MYLASEKGNQLGKNLTCSAKHDDQDQLGVQDAVAGHIAMLILERQLHQGAHSYLGQDHLETAHQEEDLATSPAHHQPQHFTAWTHIVQNDLL